MHQIALSLATFTASERRTQTRQSDEESLVKRFYNLDVTSAQNISLLLYPTCVQVQTGGPNMHQPPREGTSLPWR